MDCTISEAKLTLKELGYEFPQDGWLRTTKDNAMYKFPATPAIGKEKTTDQKEHAMLREWTGRYVIERLEADYRLEKVTLPSDANKSEPKSYFFHTKDCLTKDRIVVLIQTLGLFGAGVWDRDTFMKGLKRYSQMYYLDKVEVPTIGADLSRLSFIDEFGLVLMNTNLNHVDGRPIRQNSSPQKHLACVWDSFLEHSSAPIDIIVCGSGYEPTFSWIVKTPRLLSRLNKIALINPPNVDDIFKTNSKLRKKLLERTLIWAASLSHDRGKIMRDVTNAYCLSAGKCIDFGSLMESLCDSIWAYLRRPETAKRFAFILDWTVSIKRDDLEEKETDRLLPSRRQSQSKASSATTCCCTLI